MPPARLQTTENVSLEVPVPYETFRVRYGVSRYWDVYPSYIRLQVDCLVRGRVVHPVAHVVQCVCNQRGGVAVARDCFKTLRLLKMLDRRPSKDVRIEIADLGAYLLVTRQREFGCLSESLPFYEFARSARDVGVPVYVSLADRQFSDELADYIEDLVDNSTAAFPSLEAMGILAARHRDKVALSRWKTGLWKSPPA